MNTITLYAKKTSWDAWELTQEQADKIAPLIAAGKFEHGGDLWEYLENETDVDPNDWTNNTEAETYLTPAKNDGHCTVELFGRDGECIANNTNENL